MYNSIPYTWKTPRISQPVPKNCECGSLGRQTVVNAIHKHKQRPRNTHERSQSSLSLTADADSLTYTTSNLPVNTHTHTHIIWYSTSSRMRICVGQSMGDLLNCGGQTIALFRHSSQIRTSVAIGHINAKYYILLWATFIGNTQIFLSKTINNIYINIKIIKKFSNIYKYNKQLQTLDQRIDRFINWSLNALFAKLLISLWYVVCVRVCVLGVIEWECVLKIKFKVGLLCEFFKCAWVLLGVSKYTNVRWDHLVEFRVGRVDSTWL